MTRRAKKPITPKSQIRAALRQLWLRSRERGLCLKESEGRCFNCGMEPVEIHHQRPIDWERIFQVIREELLNAELLAVCRDCHQIITDEQNNSQQIIIGLKCVAEGEK